VPKPKTPWLRDNDFEVNTKVRRFAPDAYTLETLKTDVVKVFTPPTVWARILQEPFD
jgi:hypothetical protein